MSIIGKKGVVVRSVPRSSDATLAALAAFGVATVHEAQGRKGLLDPAIRPIQQDRGIAGNAVTVLAAPGDNWMFHVAVEQCRPGDILVVAPTSPVSTATSAICWPPRCRRTACAGWWPIWECATPARCVKWASRSGRGRCMRRAR